MKTFEFRLGDPPSKIFKMIRDDLVSMRKKTDKPRTLEWQVHLYDFILSRKDPDAAVLKYMDSVREFIRSGSVDGFAGKLQTAADAVGFTEPMPPEGT